MSFPPSPPNRGAFLPKGRRERIRPDSTRRPGPGCERGHSRAGASHPQGRQLRRPRLCGFARLGASSGLDARSVAHHYPDGGHTGLGRHGGAAWSPAEGGGGGERRRRGVRAAYPRGEARLKPFPTSFPINKRRLAGLRLTSGGGNQIFPETASLQAEGAGMGAGEGRDGTARHRSAPATASPAPAAVAFPAFTSTSTPRAASCANAHYSMVAIGVRTGTNVAADRAELLGTPRSLNTERPVSSEWDR